MMKRKSLPAYSRNIWLVFLVVFLSISEYYDLSGQSGILPGQWRSHLSYREGRYVTQSPDKIIFASQKGLFTIDKEDNSVRYISREDGLSDVDVTGLFYDRANDQLLVLYTNNRIDILQDDVTYTIPAIETNTTIIGSKTINDLYLADSQRSYLATDFGVLGFDPRNREFRFTTFTQQKVFSVSEVAGYLYAATETGLYRTEVDSRLLSDFSAWQKIPGSQGLPSADIIRKIRPWKSKLLVWQDNDVFLFTPGGMAEKLFSPEEETGTIRFLSTEGEYIMVGTGKNNQTRVFFLEESGLIAGIRQEGCLNLARDAVQDEKGRVWYADEWEPVRYTEGLATGECRQLRFPVPFTNDASQIRFRGEKAYVASGGVTEDYQYKFTRYGYYTLEGGEWMNFNQDNIPEIGQLDFLNLFSIAPAPKSDEIYLGSYYNGLMVYDEKSKKVRHWNKDNSLLQGVTGDAQRTRIAGLAFDKSENLWIANYGSPAPLVVKTPDDKWYRFVVPGSNQLADIAIDPSGNKWIVVPGAGNGILVYNEGGVLSSTTDDRRRLINRNNSILPGNKVNSVLVDLDGAVWVGTDQGPVVFDCGDPFQETSCRGNTRPVVVDGIPALLLRGEDILCIEADGANRKWFGTRNGVFVQSPDGTEQVVQFNVQNSPLLDNKVIDLAFNPLTGDMMIVTASGIQTYRTFTTGGARSHGFGVYAYPNPVRPDYDGDIAIKGLVRDANVKITDVQGRLVYETRALGGQAIWDGRDYNGVKAATGVYLVFSASENTSLDVDAYVTKILIID